MSKPVNLVISAISPDRPGIVNELSEIVMNKGCNVEDSRMVVLGGSFAIIMMVTGSAEQIKELGDQKDSLAQVLNLTLNFQKTSSREEASGGRPYQIDVVSFDHPGIIHDLSDFVASRDINIEELNTETYSAPHTGTTMFKCHMTVNIPADIKISGFRDELFDFCDQQNLDIQFEPRTPG